MRIIIVLLLVFGLLPLWLPMLACMIAWRIAAGALEVVGDYVGDRK